MRRSRAGLRHLVMVVAMLLAPLAAAQEAAPPLRIDVEIGDSTRAVDVFRASGTPLGVAVIAHGFTRSRVRHGDLGRALAARGVTTVIPDLPSIVNLWGNGDAIADLVGKIERGEIPSVSATRERIVLVGTSAGGLATVIAAAKLPGIAGWVGLDPVDRTGTGASAAAELRAPAVVMLADPSLCNLVTSGDTIASALPQRLRTVTVTGASHCDFEDPTNNMCEAACGRGSQELREAIRAEIVATVRDMLIGPVGARAATFVPPSPSETVQ